MSVGFPALFLALLYTMGVQAAEVMIKTDLNPEVVDYRNCRDKMLEMVIKPGGLLERELSNNKDFKSMWNSDAKCQKIPGGRQEHMAALNSYTYAKKKYQDLFDNLLYKNGKNITTYRDEFPFKSLYFLLTDALQLLNKNTCNNVYLGTGEKIDLSLGELVRFRSFSSAKLKFNDVTEDAEIGGGVFNITSCSVANLEESGCGAEEYELLISPTEVFEVKDITTVRYDGENILVVNLMNIPKQSTFDCSVLFSLAASHESSNLLRSSLVNLMSLFVMLYVYILSL